MYQVTAYASWEALAAGRRRLHGTFTLRGAAMEAADACAYPIVDVRDIGEPGRCPGRPFDEHGHPRGHRFALSTTRPVNSECLDCQADEADLYEPGTYIPRPADDRLRDGPAYG